jgi:hypothetical protein
VDRPEPVGVSFAHAGYTQTGKVLEKGPDPTNVIPAQYSITAILRLLQRPNALPPIDVTLLGIVTDVSWVHP